MDVNLYVNSRDEIQDFSAEELRLIREIIEEGPNDLFLVGDNHQRLYSVAASFASCGIQIRGRSHRLTLNYRTTEKIRQQAVKVLEGIKFNDQDGGEDHLHGYYSLRQGIDPVYHLSSSAESEMRWIVEQIKSWLTVCKAEEICVASRAGWMCHKYIRGLKAAGLNAIEVTENTTSGDSQPGVRVSTMHRLKGTEFKRMILAGVHSGMLPLINKSQKFADAASKEDHERQERSLFYVAATRARDVLVISGYGERSAFLIPDNKATRLDANEVEALVSLFEGLPASVVGVVRHLCTEPLAPPAILETQLLDYEITANDGPKHVPASVLKKVQKLLKIARKLLMHLGQKQRPVAEQMLAQVAIRYLVLQDDAAPDFATPEGLEDDAQVLQVVSQALNVPQ